MKWKKNEEKTEQNKSGRAINLYDAFYNELSSAENGTGHTDGRTDERTEGRTDITIESYQVDLTSIAESD